MIAASGTASNAVKVAGKTSGSYRLPGTMTGTALRFHGCDTETGTFAEIFSNAATPAVLAHIFTVSKDTQLPPECFLVNYLKLVSQSAEAAARTIRVTLKG